MSRQATSTDLQAYVTDRQHVIEVALDRLLPPETAFPDVVHRAMRYSVFAGSKRLRPLLVLEAAAAVGGSMDAVLPAACAIELIHTYSLIHDDLPSMDDAPLRRGRPTSHVVFGEAVAVLAGDALHALAFELLAQAPSGVAPATALAVTHEIAGAIGTQGMVGGQVLDLLGERRSHLPQVAGWLDAPEQAVRDIHVRKTGTLIRASVRTGALLSGAGGATLAALSGYGERLGLAFQIIDDVLDEVGEPSRMGKATRQDALASKLTFPSVYGIARSRDLAAGITREAVDALAPLGPGGSRLADLARLLLERAA